MAGSQRKVRLAFGYVRHDPGVQLDVGSADADPLDVDEQLVCHRHQILDLLNPSAAWRRDDERAHQLTDCAR
jgi:hypothetical protein